jgi:hypothetical protein
MLPISISLNLCKERQYMPLTGKCTSLDVKCCKEGESGRINFAGVGLLSELTKVNNTLSLNIEKKV